MEIGKPKRIHRVEPLQDPVPRRRPVEAPPQHTPKAPDPAPAR